MKRFIFHSIFVKIFSGFFILTTFYSFYIFFGYYQLQSVKLHARRMAPYNSLRQLGLSLEFLESNIDKFFTVGYEEHREKAALHLEELLRLMQPLKKISDNTTQDLIQSLEKSLLQIGDDISYLTESSDDSYPRKINETIIDIYKQIRNARQSQDGILQNTTNSLYLYAIEQNSRINNITKQFLSAAILILVVSLIISFILSKIISKPINMLRSTVEAISQGSLDVPIAASSRDEIGELAVAFRNMVSNIKEKRSQIMQAKIELENLSRNLEKSIEDRTKELAHSQEATLNIMEDLQDAYNKLKDTQTQLIQAEKLEAIGRMASGVAHEVKNPLGIILQGVNFLEGKASKEPTSVEILQMIKDNVKRADGIIRALVDFSKASELKLVPENINSIMETSLVLVEHRVKLGNVKVEWNLDKSIPKVLVDKGKLEQVFINLYVNAIQAMPKGGKLFVRSTRKNLDSNEFHIGGKITDSDSFEPGEEVAIVEVEDTGVGMAEDKLHKIFDPFFTTKGPGGGTGLGLAVTKNIIDMHKGIIEVESTEGKGTKFILVLKCAMT